MPNATPEEALFRKKSREFAEKNLRPTAVDDDRDSHFRKELFHEAARLGLTSIVIPEEFGGGSGSYISYFGVIEELARASASFAVITGVINLVQGAICAFGTDEQKRSLLPKLTSGEWLGAFSLSESHSGSDAASLRLSAKKTSDGYLLSGTKLWCTNGGVADLYLVMARTGALGPKGISSFLVTATSKGFRVGKQEKKLGLRSSTLSELIFEECFVPESMRLGTEGNGFEVALSQLDIGRIGIGVCGLGLTSEALDIYYRASHKESYEGMSRYYAELMAAQALVAHTAQEKDRKERVTVPAAAIKLLGSDLAMRATSRVIDALGVRGVVPEAGVERLLRDAKALQIVEGTNQIQCIVLSRHLEKMVES
jgi:alkylation response protein AidB-like acyl-CoA dehydrogenase